MAKPKKYILGVDPGPEKSGVCTIDINNKTVIYTQVMTTDELIDYINAAKNIKGIAIEKAIMYTFPKAKINNKTVAKTIFVVGRIWQAAIYNNIPVRQKIRSEIIKDVFGKQPGGKGNKVTKAMMQEAVKIKLGLDNVIRPQHCNDAAAAILSCF